MTEKAAIDDLRYLIEEYSAYPPETGVYSTIGALNFAIQSLEEIQQYREIGTVEACREAAEKQKAKRPRIHKERFSSTYSCQKCGCVLIHKDETGWFCGRHYKFCPDCGEPIDWSEEE